MQYHHYSQLIQIFSDCFEEQYQTRLVKGEGDPVYLPRSADRPLHEIRFAHGFFSSALHECAHWLIAGHARRQREDFGYWYEPDGRSVEQQRQFEQVEIKPQAIEWILSNAAGYRFRVSVDNLSGTVTDSNPFKTAVHQQVMHYVSSGLPQRADRFRQAICRYFGTPLALRAGDFDVETL